MSNRWDKFFLDLALRHAQQSKDPSTQVGAVIISQENEILCGGFNGFPRGIADTVERWNDRETKLQIVVHAELNSLMMAAKRGVYVNGCTMYLVARDVASGRIWGGAPCTRCLVHVIQAGIKRIVTYPANVPERWLADIEYSRSLIDECGMEYREVPHE